MSNHPKIFGIGLSKTGTHSLNDALNILGFPSIHHPDDDRTLHQLERGDYQLDVLERYQCITDIVPVPFFAQLDEQWPGSKFILTVRDKASWLDSVEKNWASWEAIHGDDEPAFNRFIHTAVYGVLRFHRGRFSHIYDEHHRRVYDYFQERVGVCKDVLIMDICDGQGWETLCSFLNVPVPDQPFPKSYTKKERERLEGRDR